MVLADVVQGQGAVLAAAPEQDGFLRRVHGSPRVGPPALSLRRRRDESNAGSRVRRRAIVQSHPVARWGSGCMSETSASLLEQLRLRPDAAAWQRLVDLYTPLIRGWMRRHAPLRPEDADD